jgi:hypothetical protein
MALSLLSRPPGLPSLREQAARAEPGVPVPPLGHDRDRRTPGDLERGGRRWWANVPSYLEGARTEAPTELDVMTDHQPEQHSDPLAPIDYIVVEFPDGIPTAGGFDQLLDLVDRHVIRILDVEFIMKNGSSARVVSPTELPTGDGVDLITWQGASSGLLDAEDLAAIGAEMADGAVAVVVVFENVWVLGLVERWSATGARLIFDGAVPPGDLLDALDATELS